MDTLEKGVGCGDPYYIMITRHYISNYAFFIHNFKDLRLHIRSDKLYSVYHLSNQSYKIARRLLSKKKRTILYRIHSAISGIRKIKDINDDIKIERKFLISTV